MGMFDSLYEAAINAEVAVDELEEFSKTQPHCHECGSYELGAIRVAIRAGSHDTRVKHYRCEDCGSKVRKERYEDLQGKEWSGIGLYWR